MIIIVVRHQGFGCETLDPGYIPGKGQRSVELAAVAAVVSYVVDIRQVDRVSFIARIGPIICVVVGIHRKYGLCHLDASAQRVSLVGLVTGVETSAQLQLYIESFYNLCTDIGPDVVFLEIEIVLFIDTFLVGITQGEEVFHLFGSSGYA